MIGSTSSRGPIGAVLALICSLAFPGAAAAAGDSASSRPVTPFGSPITWTDCGPPAGLECARIEVPLDWDRPNGRMVGLAVIRHPAGNPGQRIGTMFINPGGPGDSGLSLVRGDPDGLDAWGDGRFDVVSWDPRGTNRSTRVRCFRSDRSEARFWAGVSIPTTIAESKRYRRVSDALARRCGKVSGWLLPHISTADTARDLDYLRRLVGDDRLTYAGLSYGTFLGQTYANMFPGRIRAMMLDGIVDPVSYSKGAEARVAGQVAGNDEVFAEFLSLCQQAGPARCALAGGARTAAARADRLFTKLKRESIPAPAASPLGLSRSRLSYGDLLLSQFAPERSPSSWPQNGEDLDAALRGDGSALETAARGYLTPAGWTGATTSAAISCADAAAHRSSRSWRRTIRRFELRSTLAGPVLGWWLWAPCASWPVRGQDAYRGPWTASTPNPVLLIGTRYDPNTPYSNAVKAERLLGNAVLLTHEGYGHLSFQDPSACVEQARTDYLVDLVTPPPDTVCLSDQQPFDPGFG